MASDAALTIGLALAAGVVAQITARHLRAPGLVALLAAGVLLGPDVAGIVHPDALGSLLPMLVGFAVAVILFEGGLNLQIRRLRREAVTIRRLVTIGALVTMLGGTLAARLILSWDWSRSVLFGALVIVTGPTVITPLLRRVKVRRTVATILEAEGVLIDPIGVIVAVVTLEIVLDVSGGTLAAGLGQAILSLGVGSALGVAGGYFIALALRPRYVVPEGFENIFTLSVVLALYQIGESLAGESGVAAVTVAGLVVGNLRTRVQKELREFKEQLTVLMIGTLFVLLAADVRIADVVALGWPGLAVVAALMLVVRPLCVVASTLSSDLELRSRAFLAWIAPRGIVAAAVASLFAQTLAEHGIAGGVELRAQVFLVIAVTVVVGGATGGLAARLLGLQRARNNGWVILGANPLARALAGILQNAGKQETVLLDANPEACHEAEAEGFRVFFGNALKEGPLMRAEVDTRRACIALTPNDEVNLLFAQRVRHETKEPDVFVALRTGHHGVLAENVHAAGASVLFGGPRMLELWALRLERGTARVEPWRLAEPRTAEEAGGQNGSQPYQTGLLLTLATSRGSRVAPADERTRMRAGDVAWLLVFEERRDEAVEWLETRGWSPERRKESRVEQAAAET